MVHDRMRDGAGTVSLDQLACRETCRGKGDIGRTTRLAAAIQAHSSEVFLAVVAAAGLVGPAA